MKAFIINKISLLGFLILLFLWFLLTIYKDNILIPKINEVVVDLFDLLTDPLTYLLILKTITNVLLAVIVSYVVSLFLGYLSYKSIIVYKLLAPFIAFLRCMPVAVVILVLILVVGTKLTPIYICLFVLIPLSYEAIYASLNGINHDLLDETKLVSNINFKIILLVHIRVQFNYLMASILSCIGLGFKVIIMGEVLAQGNNTIGGSISVARASLNSVRIFSWGIVILLIVFSIEYALNYTKKRISF